MPGPEPEGAPAFVHGLALLFDGLLLGMPSDAYVKGHEPIEAKQSFSRVLHISPLTDLLQVLVKAQPGLGIHNGPWLLVIRLGFRTS